jgi:hypothetical protein
LILIIELTNVRKKICSTKFIEKKIGEEPIFSFAADLEPF